MHDVRDYMWCNMFCNTDLVVNCPSIQEGKMQGTCLIMIHNPGMSYLHPLGLLPNGSDKEGSLPSVHRITDSKFKGDKRRKVP